MNAMTTKHTFTMELTAPQALIACMALSIGASTAPQGAIGEDTIQALQTMIGSLADQIDAAMGKTPLNAAIN